MDFAAHLNYLIIDINTKTCNNILSLKGFNEKTANYNKYTTYIYI